MTLKLPREDGHSVREVDALLVRDVQNHGDPERCLFFKDWARTDLKRSPKGTGFVALCVCGPGKAGRASVSEERSFDASAKAPHPPFGHLLPGGEDKLRHDRKAAGTIRAILSIRPDSGVVLNGLADLLEAAETSRRIEKFGSDDRLIDPKTGQPLPIRPGYKNPNPWYDG